MMHQSLKNIRIIDLSMGWAGPLACRQLADMGADVIKVESCERFDWWRSWEATPAWIADDGAEKSSAFNMVNRNKRAVTLDLAHSEGRALLLSLVGTAHAVVENFSGGVLPKLGLGYEVFKAVRENIILLSMPAFGATGPWQNFRAYGSTVEQSSGLPHLNGNPADPPTMHHVAYGDAVGGLNGAAALLVALRHQARTGEGQFVDLSQVEALLPLAAHGIMHFAATNSAPRRTGNERLDASPHGVYRCSGDDNWIVLQVYTDAQWRSLQNIVDPALRDIEDRFRDGGALTRALEHWCADKDAHALMSQLQAAAIPAAATHKASTLLQDPHLAARQYWQWMERPYVGNQPNPSPPFRDTTGPIPLRDPAPTLGQHNHDVLVDELGLSESQFNKLTGMGVIGNRPRMPAPKS